MVVIHEADSTDPLSDQPIRCQIEVHPSGMLTVLRSPGCTTTTWCAPHLRLPYNDSGGQRPCSSGV